MNAFDAIYSNNMMALREYLETGDINVKNERGMSLIHYAIVFANSEVFDLFCEENKVFPNDDGPSQWLRENGKYEDFRAFYDTMVAKKIEIWLEKVTEKMK